MEAGGGRVAMHFEGLDLVALLPPELRAPSLSMRPDQDPYVRPWSTSGGLRKTLTWHEPFSRGGLRRYHGPDDPLRHAARRENWDRP